LASLAKRGLLTVEALAGLDEAAVREALAFAARVAAITVTRAGADPPWAHEM
jgi:fructokinase